MTMRLLALCLLAAVLWIPSSALGQSPDSGPAATTPFPSFGGEVGEGAPGVAPAAAKQRAAQAPSLRMSLAEAVFLALRHNRNVKSAYLNRVVQKFSLELSEHEFKPDLDITASHTHTETRSKTLGSEATGSSRTWSKADTNSLATALTQNVPTGGAFDFVWTHSPTDSLSASNDDRTRARASANSWAVTFLVSTLAVVLGIIVSCAVGLFFGFYPARSAARLNPITALRAD